MNADDRGRGGQVKSQRSDAFERGAEGTPIRADGRMGGGQADGRRRFGALRTLAGVAGGFAAGAIPTGELVTRGLTGRRLQDLGDGKAGSSNVVRSVGWKAGTLVFALDVFKGFAPAQMARLAGAGQGTVAATGIAASSGHIAVVKGRGVATGLGAAFAMDPAAMAVGCVPLVAGSLLHRHAQAVTVTALSLPLISLVLHRSPRRALGPAVLIGIIFAARLRGQAGSPPPDSPGVYWNRFLLDRDER